MKGKYNLVLFAYGVECPSGRLKLILSRIEDTIKGV